MSASRNVSQKACFGTWDLGLFWGLPVLYLVVLCSENFTKIQKKNFQAKLARSPTLKKSLGLTITTIRRTKGRRQNQSTMTLPKSGPAARSEVTFFLCQPTHHYPVRF